MPERKHGHFEDGWWEERNARRRERYSRDEQFREAQKAKSREAYREKTGLPTMKAADYHANFQAAGQKHRLGPKEVTVTCYTCEEVGEIFSTTAKQVRRWIETGRVPPPSYSVRVKNNSLARVYLHPEMKVIVEVLGAHFENVLYLRKDHVEVIDELHERVEAARKSWEEKHGY